MANINAIPHPIMVDLQKRVERVEDGLSQSRDESAARNIQIALIQQDVTHIKGDVGGIYKGIHRILWAIGLSVLGAATTFVLSGGFVIIQQ